MELAAPVTEPFITKWGASSLLLVTRAKYVGAVQSMQIEMAASETQPFEKNGTSFCEF